MLQIGAGISGFALWALVSWKPVWRLAMSEDPTTVFSYFVVVIMLLFGVMMVSAARSGMTLFRIALPLAAGVVCSAGYGASVTWLALVGAAGVLASFVMMAG